MGRFGDRAVEALIDQLLALGSRRERLRAKLLAAPASSTPFATDKIISVVKMFKSLAKY